MDVLNKYTGVFGIIIGIIQTVISWVQQRRQAELQELQQQYQTQVQQLNQAYSEAASQASMYNSYAYQENQQYQSTQNQLFEGGAGNNPSISGIRHNQKIAQKAANLSRVYAAYAKKETAMMHQIQQLEQRDATNYQNQENYVNSVDWGLQSFASSFSRGPTDPSSVENDAYNTLSSDDNALSKAKKWMQQIEYISQSVDSSDINSVLQGQQELQNLVQDINNNVTGDIWIKENFTNTKKHTHTSHLKRITRINTPKTAVNGTWHVITRKNANTRMATRRVKPLTSK